MILAAMRESSDIHAHGNVSKHLLDNLDEFQDAWANWRPEVYRKITISADREIDDHICPEDSDAIATFSGGVDGAFTVYRHAKGVCGRSNRNIKAGVFIHGMEIPIDEEEVFDNTARRMEIMLNSLGIDLIPIATNHRDFGDLFKDSHAILIVSCMLFLEDIYHTALIASSKPFNDLVLPWGSNPLTDRLLSSGRMRVVHDDIGHTRSQKIELLGEWDEAMKYLRVCWQEGNLGRNCCSCEKCMRTILNMRSLGLGLPEFFEHDISDHMISRMNGLHDVSLSFYDEILDNARSRGMSGSWMTAVEKMVKRNRKALKGWRWKLRQMRETYHIRTTLKEKISDRRRKNV
jgi:hypothetical protein